jgi:hypothetical protein
VWVRPPPRARKGRYTVKSKSAPVLLITLIAQLTFTSQNFAAAAPIGNSPCTTAVTNTATSAVVSSGANCYLIFKSGTNTWTVPAGVSSMSILVIAGGGAGGSGAWGGGGGAGGVVYDSNYPVTSGSSYSISIGAGGTAGTATLQIATNESSNGSDTWFNSNSTLVAKGGGAGASYAWGQSAGARCNGKAGGSGGGATECTDGSTNPGGATIQTLPAGADNVYGNTGGSTPSASYSSGAGGGGAGAVGSPSTGSNSPGKGGNGVNNFSTWLSAISTAMSDVANWSSATSTGYIAGGGGGAASSSQVTGGFGGGGTGGVSPYNSTINGSPGVANTGSGGGGASYNGNSGTGGSGGSGLIVIRFAPADTTAPTFPSADAFNVAENSTSVASITTSESATITIFGGEDQAKFSISRLTDSSTALSFTSAPNFEAPTDVGANNTYVVVFRAVDGSSNAGYETVTVTVTDVVDTSAFNSFTLSGTPAYRTTLQITANITVSSKVTFKVNNVRIPGCINLRTSGTSPNIVATCNWKPARRGDLTLTAAASPTGAGISTSSATPLKTFVTKRSGTR